MKFVIGNWKMNGTRAILREMIERAANIQTENRVALCVPFTMLGEKSDIIVYHDETNDIVRAKAARALESGLTPIICVGETADERRAGKTLEIITSGVRESVPENVSGDIIIAYEPRWAIGAGITPTADDIATAHRVIAETLSYMHLIGTPILYGASVNSKNVADIVAIENVDGVLVGGASLKPDEFIPIIENAK